MTLIPHPAVQRQVHPAAGPAPARRGPQLQARLNRGLERKLTLVSAPAGYGKTTLLAGWAADLRPHAPAPQPTAPGLVLRGAVIGLAANSLLVFSDVAWQKSLGLTLGAPALASAYIPGLSLLSQRKRGARMLAPIAQVGRMALTNYVLQSLVCSLLFYGFGLGWYEQVGAAGLLGSTILVYLLQIPFSVFWLARWNGPGAR